MKKLVVLLLTVAMVLSLGIPAFAAADNGGFTKSPSQNKAPELVGNGDVLGVTSYADRTGLSADAVKAIEDAYAKIKGAGSNLGSLSSDLQQAAKNSGVEVSTLAVSDLFDIQRKSGSGKVSVSLKTDTLKNFVCLLHYTDGKFEVVEGAKVSADGTTLEFSEDSFSPFAIVVSTQTVNPATSKSNVGLIVGIVVAVVVLAGAGVAVFFVMKKKKEA